MFAFFRMLCGVTRSISICGSVCVCVRVYVILIHYFFFCCRCFLTALYHMKSWGKKNEKKNVIIQLWTFIAFKPQFTVYFVSNLFCLPTLSCFAFSIWMVNKCAKDWKSHLSRAETLFKYCIFYNIKWISSTFIQTHTHAVSLIHSLHTKWNKSR